MSEDDDLDKMSPAEFFHWLEQVEISNDEAAKLFNVGERTIRRWLAEDGRGPAPTAVRIIQWIDNHDWVPPEWPERLTATTDDGAA